MPSGARKYLSEMLMAAQILCDIYFPPLKLKMSGWIMVSIKAVYTMAFSGIEYGFEETAVYIRMPPGYAVYILLTAIAIATSIGISV